ncbi:MAG: hypothetical protein ABI851_12230 [Saprospiraceae bacterium]
MKTSKIHDYYEEFKKVELGKKYIFFQKVADETGLSPEYVKKAFYERGRIEDRAEKYASGISNIIPETKTEEQIVEDSIHKDRTVIGLRSKSSEYEKKYKHILNENETLQKKIDHLLECRDNVTEIKSIPKAQSSEEKNIATPIILLSDWHYEERVDPETINNLNEYNPDIAKKRWFKCIQNSLRLINIDRNHSDIRNMVLWLGGDFITGYIHEELMEDNYMSPTMATMFSFERIVSALEFYLKYGNFDFIDVPCSIGNHGRTTVKRRVSTGYKNSYEWMLYHQLARHFKSEPRIRFTIPNGAFTYLNIYGFNCRFFHGDTIQYGGGIGGLTIPLIKALQRYDQQILADYNFMGHYHQLFQATKNCIVNGSGIGFNAYAQSIGASNELPKQSYCLIDQKRGMTIKVPIFCE